HSRAENSPRDAQGTPTQSAAQDSSLQGTAAFQGTADLQGTAYIQGTVASQGTADLQGTAHTQGTAETHVVKHHALWVDSQRHKKRSKKHKKHKKKVSSVKLGRNKEEGTLSEEHYVQEEDTADPFFDDIADKHAVVTPDLERKSDETEEINIEEKEASNVKSG
ncbi:hypothetical protein Tco_0310021, partial [Tanacetum coccineum]